MTESLSLPSASLIADQARKAGASPREVRAFG
jgi:hypothetical protein